MKKEQQPRSIQVLMSAYNGEKYLPAQLDSILAQKGVQVSVLVRDDGSNDRTRRILRRYAQKYANIAVYAGENLGAPKSFFDLLKHAGTAYSYYAFADQDDIWMEDKLACAVGCLERLEQKCPGLPLLYAGNVTWASKGMQIQKKVNVQRNRQALFGNALTENICMGCTQVFNQRLLELAASHTPKGEVLHDWWMYLTASYFGVVYYSSKAHMLYRQHGKNQVGMQKNAPARWKNRIQNLGRLRHKLSRQAVLFREAYKGLLDLPAQGQEQGSRNAHSLALMCGYRDDRKKKIQLALDRNVYRQSCLDDFAYRILYLFGYL